MNIILNRSKRFCGYLVGIVFFISGVLKLLDPTGTSMIVDEYYKFMHMDFLSFSAKPVAVAVSMAESLIGAALITGVWRRITAMATLTAMGVFMLISMALLIFNPVMDCGCFGEAVHLTHTQTFVKNLILSVLSCISFFPFSALGRPKKRKYVAFSMVTAGLVLFAGYSLLYIPVVDFTDYSASARLEASERFTGRALTVDDEYEAVFIYEKNGRTREFTLDDLPDSTWTFVESRAVPKAGYRQEVFPELTFSDASGQYMSELAVRHNVMVVSVYNVERMSGETPDASMARSVRSPAHCSGSPMRGWSSNTVTPWSRARRAATALPAGPPPATATSIMPSWTSRSPR